MKGRGQHREMWGPDSTPCFVKYKARLVFFPFLRTRILSDSLLERLVPRSRARESYWSLSRLCRLWWFNHSSPVLVRWICQSSSRRITKDRRRLPQIRLFLLI